MEELAERGAGAPAGHGGHARLFGLVEAPDEGRQDVRVLRVIVVVRPVEVRGHGADEIAAVLFPNGLAEFDAGDLGDGVPLVGGFQRPGQQGVLRDGLGGVFGVDAGASQEEKLLHPVTAGAVDQIILNLKVLEQEVRRIRVIGEDAAHFRRRHEHVFRALGGVERLDVLLIGQIELSAGPPEEVLTAPGGEFAADRAADHSSVAGDVNSGILLHCLLGMGEWKGKSGVSRPSGKNCSG